MASGLNKSTGFFDFAEGEGDRDFLPLFLPFLDGLRLLLLLLLPLADFLVFPGYNIQKHSQYITKLQRNHTAQ